MDSQSTCLRELLRVVIIILHIYHTHSKGKLSHKFQDSDSSSGLSPKRFNTITMNNTTDDINSNNMEHDTIPQIFCASNNTHRHHITEQPNTNKTQSLQYSVQILNESASPVLSFINRTTTYQQVFNPSWIPQSDQVSNAGIIVQLQNCSLKPGECAYCNSTPGLGFTTCNQETGVCEPLIAPSLPAPYQVHTSYYPNPFIFYYNNLYYMLVNTLHTNHNKQYLELYASQDPTNISAIWDLTKSAFPVLITGPASLLPRNTSKPDTKHYLFFGGNGYISVSASCWLTEWQNIDYTAWLSPRNGYFDSGGVETGPSPIKLKDGNYLMLYNGYTISNTHQYLFDIHDKITRYKIKHYEYKIGWLILDGDNPSNILQRSNDALLTATFNYETGDAPFTCTQRNSVYAKAIVRMNSSSNSTELFRVYFSGADTSIGTAIIAVSYTLSHNDVGKAWLEIAVIVSIGCVVFVIIMSLVICCKSDTQSALHLTTDPAFLSIASAAGQNESYKDISGTNHHGVSYVIGSLDRKTLMNSNETNDNPNHIHACSNACYEQGSECRYLKEYGLNTSLDSNASSSTSSSSYCSLCESNGTNSNSETLRLSQISFKINETLEKESPSSRDIHFTRYEEFGEPLLEKN